MCNEKVRFKKKIDSNKDMQDKVSKKKANNKHLQQQNKALKNRSKQLNISKTKSNSKNKKQLSKARKSLNAKNIQLNEHANELHCLSYNLTERHEQQLAHQNQYEWVSFSVSIFIFI